MHKVDFGQELIEPIKLALIIDIDQYSISTNRKSLPPSGDEIVLLNKLLNDNGFTVTIINS